MYKIITLVLLLHLNFMTSKAQNFNEDGSMQLLEVSTDKNYGFKKNKKFTIKVGSISNQHKYFASLRGPNGEEISYKRLGSCCSFKTRRSAFGSGLLDMYEVKYEGLIEPILLYVNGYDYEQPKAPVGFTIKQQ